MAFSQLVRIALQLIQLIIPQSAANTGKEKNKIKSMAVQQMNNHK